ncbi:PTS sugar transporter subunit IIC [Gemella cuniculi]|uniref:PTS sugar transporter subunit IIC n=1 Tax=Gemella cuniculi TaxID=150240 RepID=UPI000418B31E|nr:PTS sugar transporter subunit IIC [Gemella cuniculi]
MSKKVKDFLNIILNGTALGIVIGLIPNAVLSTLFKYLGSHFAPDIFKTLSQAMYLLQFSVPVLVGVIIGQSLKFKPLESAVLGATVLAGSGSLSYNATAKAWTGVPMGDLFNVILVAIVGALVISLLRDKFGTVTIIFLPIAGGLVSALGLVTLPYMKGLTSLLASVIFKFTTLQPLLMCMLIAMAFSFMIVTPVSTVAMGIILFTNENFIGAGAATLGVLSAAAVLSIGTFRAKNRGASAAIILGAIKLMMPNCARKPQLFLTILTTSAITGIAGYFLNILGNQDSAGFGIIGLIGPTKSYELNQGSLLSIVLAFFVIPFFVAFVADRLYSDVLKLYKVDAYSTENLS